MKIDTPFLSSNHISLLIGDNEKIQNLIFISYDEKPGIQAVKNKHKDRRIRNSGRVLFDAIMNESDTDLFPCWQE